MSRLRLQLLAAAVFAVAWIQLTGLRHRLESGVLPIDPPTPYDHYVNGTSPIGRVLMIHGLNASKETSELISSALADGGFEVYAIDLPGHGAAQNGFQVDLAQRAIHNARMFLGENTIVAGHSVGAGLLLDLAATEHFSTIVLLAAPPIAIKEVHADRALFATGEFDVPRILRFMPIAADIGGSNAEGMLLPWGAHSSPIFNPSHIRRVVEWLGGDGSKTRTVTRMLWIGLMFSSAIVFGVGWLPARPIPSVDASTKTTLVWYAGACMASIYLLRIVRPFAWIRLFATDYLIGFLLITGLILTAAAVYGRQWDASISIRSVITAILAAAFVVAIPGILVTSHVLHLWLSDGRWWRFPFIALAGLPLFFADEMLIRRIRPRWQSELIAVLSRVLLLAFILTGVLAYNRGSAFLVMIVPVITFSWMAVWFATGVVHRHTQSALAAAIFSALVQGWAFAALFVMI